MNTITALAREGNGKGSAELVEQLSEVLRRTLSRQRPAEVPYQAR